MRRNHGWVIQSISNQTGYVGFPTAAILCSISRTCRFVCFSNLLLSTCSDYLTRRFFFKIQNLTVKKCLTVSLGLQWFGFITFAPHQSQNRASEWLILLHLEQETIFPCELGKGAALCPLKTGCGMITLL